MTTSARILLIVLGFMISTAGVILPLAYLEPSGAAMLLVCWSVLLLSAVFDSFFI